ncbi:MAG: hypothetical protein IPI96_15230 [Saprospiraceae bacterium]|nr:hypothetical protein [Saprospiraceae bacterium]
MSHVINYFIKLVLIAVTIESGYTQVYFKDQPPYSDSVELQNLYRQSIQIQDSFYQSGLKTQTLEIFETNAGKYLVIDGRLNLYKWDTDKWINISKSKYHGYNHMSKKFTYNNSIYSFGGYGFWRNQGDLIRFEWDRNEWETIPLLIGDDIGSNASFISDHYLYVINPISRNQHIDLSKNHKGLYRIDLQKREVDKLSINPEMGVIQQRMRIETDNYYLPSRDPFQILDKRNMMFKLSDITHVLDLSKQNDRSLIWIHGDSVSIQNTDSFTNLIHLDFDSIYKNAPFTEFSIIESYKFSWIVGVFILVICIGFIIYKKNGRSKKALPKFSNPILEKIINHSGKTLNQEEFDTILEIDQLISIDNQKTKRANMFKDVNSEYCKFFGVELISRIPDPSDRRKYLYQIK